MTIVAEIQSLSPSAIVELFELDTTIYPGGEIFRFHAGTNELTQPVVWQGQTYTPLPIIAEGFGMVAKGQAPRPKLRVANVNGLFSSVVAEMSDLVGCLVRRKRTFAKYLDAVNFAEGNPTANPDQHLPDDLFFVEQKVSENRYIIEWELVNAFDLSDAQIPYRQTIKDTCVWKYRGPECTYTGANYDKDNLPCDPGSDFCNKRFAGCKVRFGNEPLPFGAFPGAVRYAAV